MRKLVITAMLALPLVLHAQDEVKEGTQDFIRKAAERQKALENGAVPEEIAELLRQSEANAPGFEGVTQSESQEMARQAEDTATRALSTPIGSPTGIQLVERAIEAANQQQSGVAVDPFKDNQPEALIGDNGRYFVIFVSPGQNEDEVRGLVEEFQGRNDVKLAIRGLIPGGRSIGDTIRAMNKLIKGLEEEAPEIAIDPTLFRDLSVTSVPTIALYENGEPVAWASGLASPEFIANLVDEDGLRGDLGRYGDTAEIAERDLIEEMHERVREHDWEQTAENAKQSYWDNRTAINLTPAEEGSVRYLTPSMRVTQDITTPDGTVIARKGQVINPLETLPSRLFLVIFDQADSEQAKKAREVADRAADEGFRPMLITTRLADESFDGIGKAEKALGYPIYLLQDNVRQRFQLRHTITTVNQEGNQFRIEELAQKTENEGQNGALSQAE
jgi:conjugal transfer pilus assembly protein TraW